MKLKEWFKKKRESSVKARLLKAEECLENERKDRIVKIGLLVDDITALEKRCSALEQELNVKTTALANLTDRVNGLEEREEAKERKDSEKSQYDKWMTHR